MAENDRWCKTLQKSKVIRIAEILNNYKKKTQIILVWQKLLMANINPLWEGSQVDRSKSVIIEVGIKTPAGWQKMINVVSLRPLPQKSKVIRIEDFFS